MIDPRLNVSSFALIPSTNSIILSLMPSISSPMFLSCSLTPDAMFENADFMSSSPGRFENRSEIKLQNDSTADPILSKLRPSMFLTLSTHSVNLFLVSPNHFPAFSVKSLIPALNLVIAVWTAGSAINAFLRSAADFANPLILSITDPRLNFALNACTLAEILSKSIPTLFKASFMSRPSTLKATLIPLKPSKFRIKSPMVSLNALKTSEMLLSFIPSSLLTRSLNLLI